MKKTIFFFLILIYLSNFINAVQLGISPSILFINGSVHEKICMPIIINTNYKGILIGESKWALNSSKNIRDYKLNEKFFKLNIDYRKLPRAKATWRLVIN